MGNDMSEYTVTSTATTLTGISLYLQISVVDELGYITTQNFSFIRGDTASDEVQSGTQNAANILNVLDVSNIDSALRLHLDNFASGGDSGGGGILIHQRSAIRPTDKPLACLTEQSTTTASDR